MRILVVSPFEPHPKADHGGAVYLGTFLAELSRHAKVQVVAFAHEPRPLPLPGVPCHTVPFRRNDQLGRLELWRRRLSLLWLWGPRRLPLLVAKHRSGAFRQLLQRVQAEFRPEVCLVEFAIMAQYLDALTGPCVLTDHEHGVMVPPRIGPGTLGPRRDKALWGLDAGLKGRHDDPLSRELDAAKRHIGELSMENELLRERSRAAEGRLPLATRRSRR